MAQSETSVRCQICCKEFSVIHAKHLMLKHGVAREEYMQQFGLSPDNLMCAQMRKKLARRADYKPFSKAEVTRRVRAIFKKHGNIGAGEVQKKYPQAYRQAVGIFGGWGNVLSELGLESWIMVRERTRTKEQFLKDLREFYQARGHLRLSKELLSLHPSIHWEAIKFFGNWPSAVEAAGVSSREARLKREWTKAALNKLIRNRPQKHKMTSSEVTSFENACRVRFGSVRAAFRYNRVEVESFYSQIKWSKERVIQVLLSYRKKYGNRAGVVARREYSSLPLAVKRYIGSWNDALELAGIEPPRTPWTKEKIVEELLVIFRGRNLVCNSTIVRERSPRLASAIERHFNSWQAAFEMAGLR